MAEDVLIQTNGQPLRDKDVRYGLRMNIFAGTLGMFYVAVALGMPMTMLLEALNASGFMIGLLGTAGGVTLAMQIPGALMAQRLSARKKYWFWFALTNRLLWYVPALLPLWLSHKPHLTIQIIVITICVSYILGNSAGAVWFSWIADLVPEKSRGTFWGKRQSITMASYLLSMAISGFLLDYFKNSGKTFIGFAFVFGLATTAGTLDILVHYFVPEPKPKLQPKKNILVSLIEPLKNKDFLWLTLALGFWGLSCGLIGLFTPIYLKRDFGVSYSQLSTIVISASISTVVFGFIWGYVMDRIGARAFGVIMAVIAPLCSLVWFFLIKTDISVYIPFWGTLNVPQPVFINIIASLFSGGLFSGLALTQLSLASSIIPRGERAVAMAVHWSIVGLMTAVGPTVGGYVMDAFPKGISGWQIPTGLPFSYIHILTFLHIALAWFLVVPFLLMVKKKHDDLSAIAAASRILLLNPLRAASSIYNIWTIGSDASREKRAKAVRTLGQKRTAIAVSDLIEQLDDPSTDVREEAALALSSIGSPDAIEALVKKLEDPNSDLAPQIARGFRKTPDPSAVDALVKKLSDPDRETLSETARTLGAIGDRRATSPLLNLLQHTDDPKVVSASSEALGKLGEMAAIYEILPRMKNTRNPILKRSLAVAVGDLLGEPDGFYKFLVKEQQAPGSGVERILKDLKSSIKSVTEKKLTPEGETLIGMVGQLEENFENSEIQACADVLFSLSIGLGALLYGVEFGGDAKAYMDDLVWRDEHFSVGVWYLNLLRENWEEADLGERDMGDILLGIYFLGSLNLKKKNHQPEKK